MIAAVTGGAGRLGNVLVRALLDAGWRVRVIEPHGASAKSLEGLDVDLRRGSILDQGQVEAFVRGADVVFHLAAKVDLDRDRDGSMRAVNVVGTERIIDACSAAEGVRLVHCSSHHALIREPLDAPLDESKPLALDEPCDYHRSKAIAEKRVLDAVRDRGLDAVIVSPGTLIGPYDFGPSMMGKGLVELYRGKVKMLMEVVSDYVDARDVADGMISAAHRGRKGERYLLTGEVLDMRELGAAIEEVAGRPMPSIVLPLWLVWATMPVALGTARLLGKPPLLTPGVLRASVSNRVVSHDKAARELGYAPRPVTESLADGYAFFRERGLVDPRAAVA